MQHAIRPNRRWADMEMPVLRPSVRVEKVKLNWKRLSMYVGLLTFIAASWYGLYALMAH